MLLNILILLIGIVATFFVSRHYYNKSVDKKLTPCLIYSSDLFRFIDKEIRSKLFISYEGKEIDNLHELRFLIANDGEKTISKPIKPLTLTIKNGKVINAVIEQIHPKERKVNIKCTGNIITFDFDLLNKNEKFLIYVLINGRIKKDDYEFAIVEEELSPKLNIRELRFDHMVHELTKKEGIDIGFIIFISLIFLSVWSIVFLFAVIGIMFIPWAEPNFQQLLADIGITVEHQLYEVLNLQLLKYVFSIISFICSFVFLKIALGFTKDLYLWCTKLKKLLD